MRTVERSLRPDRSPLPPKSRKTQPPEVVAQTSKDWVNPSCIMHGSNTEVPNSGRERSPIQRKIYPSSPCCVTSSPCSSSSGVTLRPIVRSISFSRMIDPTIAKPAEAPTLTA